MKFGGKQTENLDTEINIVPIIDCMVMLICFLLFTATFTQLVYIEAKLASNTAAAADKSRSEFDKFRLVIELHDDHLRLKTTGSSNGKHLDEQISAKNNAYDYALLHDKIVDLKIENPDRFSADVDVKGKNLPYETVLSVIDALHHLSDDEYGQVKVTQKQLNKLALNEMELKKQVLPKYASLASALYNNETARNTDLKLLFPDVALLGVN